MGVRRPSGPRWSCRGQGDHTLTLCQLCKEHALILVEWGTKGRVLIILAAAQSFIHKTHLI